MVFDRIKSIALAALFGGWLALAAHGGTVSLNWNPSTSIGILGYNVYYGTASRTYANMISLGNVTSVSIASLSPGTTYYFAVTSYNSLGLESDYSNETVVTVPPDLPTLNITVSRQGQVLLTGTGQPNSTYYILASQDLLNWTALGAVTTDSNGYFQFIDTTGAHFPLRTYRLQAAQAAPPNLPTLSITVSRQGQVLLTGTGQPNSAWYILASQDLINWTALRVVTIGSNGSFQFIDPAGANFPRRMYRLQAAQTVPPNLPTLSITVSRQRQVLLTGTGQPNSTWYILASQDLVNWTALRAVTIGSNGSFQFIDPTGANFPRRMYRLQAAR